MSLSNILDQMADYGITGIAEPDLIIDSKIHRFAPEGSRSQTAWYVLFEFAADNGEVLLSGRFGDWKMDVNQKFKVKGQSRLSDAEKRRFRSEQKEKADQAKLAREVAARAAAKKASALWPRLKQKGECSYLTRKGVRGHGVRYGKSGTAVVPLMDTFNRIHGLQIIYPEIQPNGRDKNYWPYGLKKEGCFFRIGNEPQSRDYVVLAEGYATGASIYEATGLTVFVVFDCGNLLPVAHAVKRAFPKCRIVVAGDDDYLTKSPVDNPGKTKAYEVAEKVRGVAVVPIFKNRPDGTKWTDFNDLHFNESLEAVRAQITHATNTPLFTEWTSRFSLTQQGSVKSALENAVLVLSNDEAWAGVLAYCDFSYRILKLTPPPFEGGETGEWTDGDTARLRIWLADHYSFSPGANDTNDAVLVAAEKNRMHPVREYLNDLVWDKKPRIEDWLPDYLGAECNSYTRAVGMKWLIAAVARILKQVKGKKGVKADNVLIIEGLQGMGKSTALSILGGDWFSDTHFTLGDKDGYQQMVGVWICELAELDAFNKAESTKAKQFFSTLCDRYRPSYGRRAMDFPRQCVFAGTTNQDSYLKDVTGNRRYWPVKCEQLNVEGLKKVRDQLWAEAVYMLNQGEPWWALDCEKDVFEEQQENRFLGDYWEELIAKFLDDYEDEDCFTGARIMEKALGLKPENMRPPEQTRVGLIMSRLGWGKSKQTIGEGTEKRRTYVYVRPVPLKRVVNG